MNAGPAALTGRSAGEHPGHRGSIFLEDGRVLEQVAWPGAQFVMRIEAPQCAARALPGSFVHLSCDPAILMRRPLSIQRVDAQAGWIEVLYKVLGVGLAALSQRKAGDVLSVLGPIGQGFKPDPARPRALLVGGGVGIPPMVFLADWMQAYPDAIAHGAPGLAEKRGDIRFHAILGDTALPDWCDEIDQVLLDNRITPEIVFFHRPSRTVLFTDLLQQMPRDYYSGWRRVVARLDLMTGRQASVPRKFRLGFANRKAARAAIGRILAWPLEQVVMAHGIPVRENASAVLRRAFAWLRV